MPNADSSVTFQPVPGFPGYVAGSDGSIWSYRSRSTRKPSLETPVKLKPLTNYQGRPTVRLVTNGGKKTSLVSTLILTTFVGPRPAGMECCHNNGIRTDNRISNLRWDTHKNNQLDRAKHGTRVSPEEDQRILKLHLSGLSIRKIKETTTLSVMGTWLAVQRAKQDWLVLKGEKS